MGLTIYHEWKTKTDLASARRLTAKFRAIALKLTNTPTTARGAVGDSSVWGMSMELVWCD